MFVYISPPSHALMSVDAHEYEWMCRAHSGIRCLSERISTLHVGAGSLSISRADALTNVSSHFILEKVCLSFLKAGSTRSLQMSVLLMCQFSESELWVSYYGT